MPQVEDVYALLASETPIPASLATVGAAGIYRLPVLLFAIDTDEGIYLVDAGVEDSFSGHSALWSAVGLIPNAKAATHRATRFRDVEALLGDLGKRREDVRGVLLTHFDYDHTGALPWLSGTPVWISRRELHHVRRVVRGVLPNLMQPRALLAAATGRYVARHLDAMNPIREIAPISDAGYGPFSRTHDLFGDGSVTAIDLGGHTPGHVGFAIRKRDGREILLSGDACLSSVHLGEEATPGALPRLFSQDWATSKRTLTLLRQLRRDRPDLTIVPTHSEIYGMQARERPLAL